MQMAKEASFTANQFLFFFSALFLILNIQLS